MFDVRTDSLHHPQICELMRDEGCEGVVGHDLVHRLPHCTRIVDVQCVHLMGRRRGRGGGGGERGGGGEEGEEGEEREEGGEEGEEGEDERVTSLINQNFHQAIHSGVSVQNRRHY